MSLLPRGTKSSTKAQWVFPPTGTASPQATPPIAADSNFGPVHVGDVMILDWTPAVKPHIDLWCLTNAGNQSYFLIENGSIAPPLTLPFTQKASQSNSSDAPYCHLKFPDSDAGNTVIWEYNNEARSSPVTFSAAGYSSTVTATASQSSISSPTASSGASSGLSTGADAGIGVGIAVIALILAGVIAFLCLRRRRRRRTPPEEGGSGYERVPHSGQQPVEMDGKFGQRPVEMDGEYRRAELSAMQTPQKLQAKTPYERELAIKAGEDPVRHELGT